MFIDPATVMSRILAGADESIISANAGKAYTPGVYDMLGASRGRRMLLWQSCAQVPPTSGTGDLVWNNVPSFTPDTLPGIYAKRTKWGYFVLFSRHAVMSPSACTLHFILNSSLSITRNEYGSSASMYVQVKGLNSLLVVQVLAPVTYVVPTVYIKYDANFYYQSSWNLDRLDGTGPSRVQLFQKNGGSVPFLPVITIDTDRTRIGFICGKHQLVYAHEFSTRRNNAPNGKVQAGVYKVSVGMDGAADPTGVTWLRSLAVVADGIEPPLMPSYTCTTAHGATPVTVPITECVVSALNGDLAVTQPTLRFAMHITGASVMNTGSAPILCRLWHFPRAVNNMPSGWQPFRDTFAGAQVLAPADLAPGTVTLTSYALTVLMDAFLVPAGQSVVHQFSRAIAADGNSTQAAPTALGVTDRNTYALTAQTLAGSGTTTVYATLSWTEYHY